METGTNPYTDGTWELRFVYNKRTGKVKLHKCLIWEGEVFHVGGEARLDEDTVTDDVRTAALHAIKKD